METQTIYLEQTGGRLEARWFHRDENRYFYAYGPDAARQLAAKCGIENYKIVRVK